MVVDGRILNRLVPKSLPAVYYHQTAIVFAIMMGMSLPSSFLPIMAQSLDPSGVLVGVVVSAWFLSRIFLDLPAGVLSDRFGRRRLLIFGIGLSLFGPMLCVYATNIFILILGRAVWGVGSAFYFMNVYALLMDILPLSVRGRALGFFQGLEYTGSFLGAPIGAFLATNASFSHVFYFSLMMTFASLVIALRSGRVKETEARGSATIRSSLREVMGSLKSWGIIVVCLCSFLRYFINAGIFGTVFQLFLNGGLLYSIEAIGIVLSVRIVGQVVSIMVAGILSDKVGRVPVLIVGYMFSALAFFAFTLVNDFGAMLVIAMLQGVGEGFGFTTLIALLTDLSPPNIRGGVVGIFRTFNDIGGFVGPIAFMLIYGGFRSTHVFYICVVLNILCMALIATLRARHNLIPILIS